MAAKTIAILALPGFQLLDLAGPLDVFAEANARAGKKLYELVIVTMKSGAIRSSAGVAFLSTKTTEEMRKVKIDTLLVAGTPHIMDFDFPPDLIAWIRKKAPESRRYGSICTGTFLLGKAGLLEKKTVTTHWEVARRLAVDYPRTDVVEDALFVRDGKLCTSAGVTAGIDLSLKFVEEDQGRELALQVAAQLVVYFKRPGGQLQFSRAKQALVNGRSAIQMLQRKVMDQPSERHSVHDLAQDLGVTPRHLTRVFTAEVGVSPARWVEDVRIDYARRRLEETQSPPKQIADECGFSSVDVFRRAFMRRLSVTPTDYRKQFIGR